MSSRTSSRSTLTTVPSTMSPSLKYLMVSSMAARNASSEPRSSTVTLLALEVASMLLVMWTVAPNGWCRGDSRAPRNCRRAQHEHPVITTTEVRSGEQDHAGTDDLRNLLPAEAHDPRVHRLAYRAHYHRLQGLLMTEAHCSRGTALSGRFVAF